MATTNLTKSDFLNKVANYEENPNEWKFLGNRPALIDFFATWCGPCKALSPILEEVAQEYEGKVDIYKVDVDAEEELSNLFKIRTVPSLLFIPMNGQPQMASGVLPKAQLKALIEGETAEQIKKWPDKAVIALAYTSYNLIINN